MSGRRISLPNYFTFYSGIFLLVMPLVIKANTYHFVSIENLIEQEIGRIVLPEIYHRLGIDISIIPLPGKRAQHQLESGQADGEIMRIYDYGLQTKNVIRIPTPYFQLETMAFVRIDSDINIQNASDLASYNVARISGVKHTDLITKNLPNVSVFNNTKQMMRVLSRGRADVALTNTIDGLIAIRDLGITNVKTSGHPLSRYALYHYVHEKNAHLVADVDHVILTLKANGELQQLIANAQSAVIDFWGDND